MELDATGITRGINRSVTEKGPGMSAYLETLQAALTDLLTTANQYLSSIPAFF